MIPIYIQADITNFNDTLDLRRGDTPAFWRGSDIEFRIAVFEYGQLRDVEDLASLTVEVRPLDAAGRRPDPAAAPLMSKTTTALDTQLSAEEWAGYEEQHARVAFTGAESAIAAGTHWFVITAQTNHTPARSLTLCGGLIAVEEDGYGTAGQAPVLDGTAYSKDEADARFARQRLHAATVFVDAANGVDATALRGRQDLPFATLVGAISAAQAGDTVDIAPGALAGATVGKALHLRFRPGVVLSSSLTVAAAGCSAEGSVSSGAAVTHTLTAASAQSLRIVGTLTLDKEPPATLALTGGLLLCHASGAAAVRLPAFPGLARGRRYSGGLSTIAADARLAAPLVNGAEIIALVWLDSYPAAGVTGAVLSSLSTTEGYGAEIDATGRLRFVARKSGAAVEDVYSVQTVPLAQWTWVRAKVVAADTVELWIGGTECALTSNTLTATAWAADAQAKCIGARPDTQKPLAGIVTRLALLNATLTDAEWLACVSTGVLPAWASVDGSMANQIYSTDNSDFTGTTTNWTAGTLDAANDEMDLSLAPFGGSNLGATYLRMPRKGERWRATLTVANYVSGTLVFRQGGGTNQQTGATANANGTFVGTFTADSDWITQLQFIGGGAGFVGSVQQVSLVRLGNLLHGLDLGRQPVQARTAAGLVALDSATGVALEGPTPDTMQLWSTAAMTADGYLCADQAIIPAGWGIDQVYCLNRGSAATVTLRYDSSGGTELASGTVGTGASAYLTLANRTNARDTARKVHISGLSGTSASAVFIVNLSRV